MSEPGAPLVYCMGPPRSRAPREQAAHFICTCALTEYNSQPVVSAFTAGIRHFAISHSASAHCAFAFAFGVGVVHALPSVVAVAPGAILTTKISYGGFFILVAGRLAADERRPEALGF